jgi:hypothetical protein
MPGPFRTRADQNEQRDAEAASRVRQVAGRWKEVGAKEMPVSLVLDLLDPAGDWTREPVPLPSTLDPRADPMTGCLPVTPS